VDQETDAELLVRLRAGDERAFVTLVRRLAGCPHCTEYLAQMRAITELAGRLTPADLTPQMQDAFIALYRTWRAGGPGGRPAG